MAPVVLTLIERRRDCRRVASHTRWRPHAVLRPGMPVTLVDITPRAALVECASQLRPGALTEMQLSDAGGRTSVRGRLDRCYVCNIDPLRYRGVLMFETPIDLETQG